MGHLSFVINKVDYFFFGSCIEPPYILFWTLYFYNSIRNNDIESPKAPLGLHPSSFETLSNLGHLEAPWVTPPCSHI